MRRRRAQVTIAAVTFLLGLLVVVQLRTCEQRGVRRAVVAGPDGARRQSRRSQRRLRTEVATLEREIVVLEQNSERGDMSLDELRADLRRVRLYAGIDPASGPGVSIVVRGPIDGPGIEDLVNEPATPGGSDGDRQRPPRARGRGDRVAWCHHGRRCCARDPFTLSAIGAPDKLTGSLTRPGGIIAQLSATQPDVTVDVTPMDRIGVPATDRDLVPSHGRPRL